MVYGLLLNSFFIVRNVPKCEGLGEPGIFPLSIQPDGADAMEKFYRNHGTIVSPSQVVFSFLPKSLTWIQDVMSEL